MQQGDVCSAHLVGQRAALLGAQSGVLLLAHGLGQAQQRPDLSQLRLVRRLQCGQVQRAQAGLRLQVSSRIRCEARSDVSNLQGCRTVYQSFADGLRQAGKATWHYQLKALGLSNRLSVFPLIVDRAGSIH